VWVGQPRKGAQGWVKSEAGPPGIKRPRRRRGRQAPRPPPRVAAAAQQTCPSSCAGKGTADAGARAESAARALPPCPCRGRRVRPAGHVHGTASGRFFCARGQCGQVCMSVKLSTEARVVEAAEHQHQRVRNPRWRRGVESSRRRGTMLQRKG